MDAPTGIETRYVPERRLASVRGELFQPEVAAFLERGFTLLFEFTNAHPGLRSRHTTLESPTYALYYGTFGFDAPTLVEACVVLDGDVEPHGDIAVRTEPAHWEAYVPLTKRRLALPALTAAYDELGEWVSRSARMLTSIPPREVYIADVMGAGADDHVCDVAFPFEQRR
ncbi:GyrI-like domain-containing protein [Demequina lutea]|uniref:GyrI-like small molecule binding domain-containing protein n=1 Tax=Demequina lutea TaxID=431489 RepID=A0A7Z0CLA0_9MICO|nr:GyrI-like domain-containing protein [Demequina lutea]NYI42703.1 hypothetical protein [Demequina lutea]